MKSWWRTPASAFVAAALVLSLLPAPPAVAATGLPGATPGITVVDDPSIELPTTGQVIVKFQKPEAAASAMAVAASGGRVKAQSNRRRMVVKLPAAAAQARQMIKALRALPGVEYVENDGIMQKQAVPNDPMFSQLWGLQRIHADSAWSQFVSNQTAVTVAVVDSGVDAQHEDLAAKVLPGINITNQSTDTTADVSSLSKGTYTILVTATVPDFPGLSKTATTTFSIP